MTSSKNFAIIGRYSDNSGGADFGFYAGNEEEAARIAKFLDRGEYMHMGWEVVPLKWISVPREDEDA